MTDQPDPPADNDTSPPDGTVEPIADPRRRFETPEHLLAEPGISDAEKLALLQEWEAALGAVTAPEAELEAVQAAIVHQAKRIGQSA